MSRFDINCMIGHWPFRKLGHNKPEDILKVHAQNDITAGCISSLDSVLYNDPYEGDEDLAVDIKKMNQYLHIQSVNPLLSFSTDDIKRGVELLGVKGVKIYPCYHQYNLDAVELEPVCKCLREYDIPLFVQLRMEDYRADYIMLQKQLGVKDIDVLLNKYPDIKIVLLTPRLNEIKSLASVIRRTDRVLLDTSGLKDGLFAVESVVDSIGPDKLAYGSLYPLFCLKSTLMLVEEAQLDQNIKQKIYSENAKKFL